MRSISFAILWLICSINVSAQKIDYTYKNSNLPISQRVKSLLQQMTLEEKVCQMLTYTTDENIRINSLQNKKRHISEQFLNQHFSQGIGMIGIFPTNSINEYVSYNNEVQNFLKNKTRLGIPAFFFAEGLHGLAANGATVFPQNSGLGCTWDTLLIKEIQSITALEMRARGINQALSPVIDVSRDIRWGRTEECYSEDPYLVAQLGKAAVLGFQGSNYRIDTNHVVATLKHFAGHGSPEGGKNIAPISIGEHQLREVYLLPFETCVKQAMAASIMVSYNENDGLPNHANSWLCKKLLREEWNFNGYLMSDGGGIEMLLNTHTVVNNLMEAGILALNTGIDFDLNGGENCAFSLLLKGVHEGKIAESLIDTAVKNILTVKFRAGLFERNTADSRNAYKITNCKSHQELALKAAHEAVVMLKNENSILPLNPNYYKSIGVIGPNAAEVHLGGYSPEPRIGISILEGIKQFSKTQYTIKYAEGCRLTNEKGTFWYGLNPTEVPDSTNRRLLSEAITTASNCDIIILCLGENENLCREAFWDGHRGDRADLDLFGFQKTLLAELKKLSKPIVALLTNGRPIASPFLENSVPAILECWYLGQETGIAIADILFGKISPSGKLSYSIPFTVGEIPSYYSKKPSVARGYLFEKNRPLYPFGYGLSYTSFHYGKPILQDTILLPDKSTQIAIDITNNGIYDGTEIVQLYIRDKISSITRPIKELKDFARVDLNSGETKKVIFKISPDKLWFYNKEMKRVIEPGEFEILIGPNSEDLQKVVLTSI